MPNLTILTHPMIPGIDAPSVARTGYPVDDVSGASLEDALTTAYGTDAHMMACAPVEVELDEDATTLIRPTYGVLGELDITMVALIGDVDAPGHSKDEDWAAETRERLNGCPYAWYETRGGFRIVAPLKTSDQVTISSRSEAAQWTEFYLGWCEWLQSEHGLELDRSCKDWTRLYRLPNVIRDGIQTPAAHHRIMGALSNWDVDHWTAPTALTKPKPTADRKAPARDDQDAVLARAHALASRLPPSVEGHDGDLTLFRAANEIATVVGPDSDLIEAVLTETFNPRCLPEWPASKLTREAHTAAGRRTRDASIERLAERWQSRTATGRTRVANDPELVPAGSSDAAPLWDWSQPEQPIDWICKQLAIAPSDRKVTIIGGNPGAGKGPLAGYLATCFAVSGLVFGSWPAKRCNVGILDFEGARLSARRIASYARGMGVDPKTIGSRIQLRDASPSSMLDPDLGWVRDWVRAAGIEVLIVDSYTSAASGLGLDPNKLEFGNLALALGSLGICVIIVAHARKPGLGQRGEKPLLGDIAGSAALGGYAATGISVWRPDDDDPALLRIGCMRAPDEWFPSFDIRWHRKDDGRVWFPEMITAEDRDVTREDERRVKLSRHANDVIAQIRFESGEVQTRIRERSGVSGSTFARVIGMLVDADIIRLADGARGATCVLPSWRGSRPRVRCTARDDGGDTLVQL